jgi:hypothetical protein
MYTEVWERLVASHDQVQNMGSSSVKGKVIYLVVFSKACIQVYAEFPQRLLVYDHRYGMIVFTPASFKSVTIFTRRSHQLCTVLQTFGMMWCLIKQGILFHDMMLSLAQGKLTFIFDNHSLWITFCSGWSSILLLVQIIKECVWYEVG